MFFTKAPPQRASAARENGFSFLSWKRKTFLAVTVILCGGGIAAQFPTTTMPEERFAVSSGVSKPTASEDFTSLDRDTPEPEGLVLSQPKRQYAENIAENSQNVSGYTVSRPEGPIAKYTPPPKMGGETDSDSSPKPVERYTVRKPKLSSSQLFDSVDYSGFEKTSLDLPLARWNPLFDQMPPLSGMKPQSRPFVDENDIVAAKQETGGPAKLAQSDYRVGETVSNAMIDFDALVPAKNQVEESVFEAMIDPGVLVTVQQAATDSEQETDAVVPEEFIVPTK